jgi:hypothetical protein
MAIQTTFGYGLMLKQEWAALFRMASPASFIHRIFLQKLRACRTMKVVAVRASDFTCANGVNRHFVAVGALILVAGEAHFGLSLLVTHIVVAGMNFVARGTSYIITCVLTAFPVSAFITIVTGEAGFITHGSRRRSIFSKSSIRLGRFITTFMTEMAFAVSMTACTGWSASIRFYAVFGFRNREQLR